MAFGKNVSMVSTHCYESMGDGICFACMEISSISLALMKSYICGQAVLTLFRMDGLMTRHASDSIAAVCRVLAFLFLCLPMLFVRVFFSYWR